MPTWLMLLLAAACGTLVANLYYAQPLIGPVSASLGLTPAAAGLIVTLAQAGYGLGLLLLVPLGDLVENRRLVVAVVGACAVALAVAALSTTAIPFLLASLAVGVCAVAAQILVPYAAHLAPERMRGRVVGNVMSGLLLGIMLARPVSSFIAGVAGWHAVFWLSAVLTAALALLLWRLLPRRQPQGGLHYGALLASMAWLWRTLPVLRRRAFCHAGLFAAFSLFWTTVPLHLAEDFGFTQSGIAIFALVAVAGALVAPLAGRLADRGQMKPGLARGGMLLALALGVVSFPVSLLGTGNVALAALVVSAILLDGAVTLNLILSQRAVFALGETFRSRLNGLFMAVFFTGGAVGSALGGWAMARGGWELSAWVGMALPGAALLYALTERKPR
ncbi:MAG: araJ [Roseomonas sp.]|jgi:predicted MFS family arabinose efflux permease|nr:araJ [Roseomonas sp.]